MNIAPVRLDHRTSTPSNERAVIALRRAAGLFFVQIRVGVLALGPYFMAFSPLSAQHL